MAFQSVPGTAEATPLYVVNGETVQNTFHFQRTNYNSVDLQDLADAVDDAIGTLFLPQLPNAVSYLRTEVRGLQFENDLTAISLTNAGPGLIASPELPLNATFAIKRISGLTGRSARGRIYWPCLSNGALQSDGNFITQGARDAFTAACNGLSVLAITAGWLPVIVSRFSGGVKRDPTAITFPLTAYTTTDLRVDSRRDRLPGN